MCNRSSFFVAPRRHCQLRSGPHGGSDERGHHRLALGHLRRAHGWVCESSLLTSKPLSARARGAIREAIRLDGIEAPRRELERLKKEAADASAARDEANDKQGGVPAVAISKRSLGDLVSRRSASDPGVARGRAVRSYLSNDPNPRLCLGKGVYSARIAFLSTAAARRGIPRP